MNVLNLADAQLCDIVAQKGNHDNVVMQFTDSNNAAISLTGNTYRLDLFRNAGENKVMQSVTAAIGASPFNTLTVPLATVLTNTQGNYFYKLVVRYSDATERVLMKGNFIIQY